jgi:hypothetical protein
MRSRASLFLLALLLLLTIVACSSKPASDSAANADQNAASSSAGGGAAGASKEMAKTPEPTLVVPEGTTLTVRLGQALGSKISNAGDPFTATLAAPVEVDGKTAIPSGATARGTVTDAKALGKFKGGAVLQIKLNSITVNGTEHAIATSSVSRTEKGKGKRTAVVTGGGAAVGALIGGLAGGGKGAAIGALAGGGAGAAGSAYTGNKDIVLPAESAVSFKLAAPLELK